MEVKAERRHYYDFTEATFRLLQNNKMYQINKHIEDSTVHTTETLLPSNGAVYWRSNRIWQECLMLSVLHPHIHLQTTRWQNQKEEYESPHHQYSTSRLRRHNKVAARSHYNNAEWRWFSFDSSFNVLKSRTDLKESAHRNAKAITSNVYKKRIIRKNRYIFIMRRIYTRISHTTFYPLFGPDRGHKIES